MVVSLSDKQPQLCYTVKRIKCPAQFVEMLFVLSEIDEGNNLWYIISEISLYEDPSSDFSLALDKLNTICASCYLSDNY